MFTFLENPIRLEGSQLEKGMKMPEFHSVKADLSEFNSADIKGKKIILSVPSVDTPVCSMELSKFMNKLKERKDVTCISVSMDLPFALDRWCQANSNDKVITTSDYRDREFARLTGTRIKENGLLTRAVFVVDENDEIIHVEYVPEVSHEPNYENVLSQI